MDGRIFIVISLLVITSKCSPGADLNKTSEHQLKETAVNAQDLSSPILDDSLEVLDEKQKINSTFKQQQAESRLFPIGHPSLIASPPLPLSPFDVTSFSNSLIPLHIPAIGGQPASHHHPKFPPHHKKLKEKAPTSSTSESYSVDNMMHDYGINGYKHFEETILKELERQEEAKVEATIHTLFNEGDHVEIVRGKPHHVKSGWKPMLAAPTKTYEDSNDITSQIVSPLHTSIFSLSELPSESSLSDKLASGFHDFDSFHSSSYAVNEEAIESKVKPVKAKIASIKRVTPIPSVYASRSSSTTTSTAKPTLSRSRVTYATTHLRKRHNSLKTADEEKTIKSKETDSSVSESNDIPAIAKVRQLNNIHVQSLTTSKPKNHANVDRNSTLDITKGNNFESASRFRTTASSFTTKSTFKVTKLNSTTSRPKTVQRETSKFVDRARASGYRGSVKYGQSTFKEEDKN